MDTHDGLRCAVLQGRSADLWELSDATVRRRLADIGQEIFPREQQTPHALAAYQTVEIDKWWPIVKEANIKAE